MAWLLRFLQEYCQLFRDPIKFLGSNQHNSNSWTVHFKMLVDAASAGVKLPPPDYDQLVGAIKRQCAEHNLQPTDAFLLKVTQLYEVSRRPPGPLTDLQANLCGNELANVHLHMPSARHATPVSMHPKRTRN